MLKVELLQLRITYYLGKTLLGFHTKNFKGLALEIRFANESTILLSSCETILDTPGPVNPL